MPNDIIMMRNEPMEEIIADFDDKKELYKSFNSKVYSTIKELIDDSNIQIHNISSRVKERKSLLEKIESKNGKYNNLLDITDISGIRVITYFDNDVDTIAKLVEKEFEIDIPNSVDKRNVAADKFGYMSVHYVAGLSKSRLDLTENKKYEKLKFELQIRSILQHSWAEIEHDLGYKGEFTIPQFSKRSFHRIAALLETADIEFSRLKQILYDYEQKIKNGTDENLINESINKVTLAQFIKNSKVLLEVDNSIVKSAYKSISDKSTYNDSRLNELLLIINKMNITNFDELTSQLQTNKKNLVELKVTEKTVFKTLGKGKFIKGGSISVLGKYNDLS